MTIPSPWRPWAAEREGDPGRAAVRTPRTGAAADRGRRGHAPAGGRSVPPARGHRGRLARRRSAPHPPAAVSTRPHQASAREPAARSAAPDRASRECRGSPRRRGTRSARGGRDRCGARAPARRRATVTCGRKGRRSGVVEARALQAGARRRGLQRRQDTRLVRRARRRGRARAAAAGAVRRREERRRRSWQAGDDGGRRLDVLLRAVTEEGEGHVERLVRHRPPDPPPPPPGTPPVQSARRHIERHEQTDAHRAAPPAAPPGATIAAGATTRRDRPPRRECAWRERAPGGARRDGARSPREQHLPQHVHGDRGLRSWMYARPPGDAPSGPRARPDRPR